VWDWQVVRIAELEQENCNGFKVRGPRPVSEIVWINNYDLTETPAKQAPEGAGQGRPDFCEAKTGMS